MKFAIQAKKKLEIRRKLTKRKYSLDHQTVFDETSEPYDSMSSE